MKKVIMTVDDSISIRRMVGITLRNADYEVLEAVDGKDALSKINGVNITMIILDLYMPEMNGIEFIRSLRSDPTCRYIPILMLTTESEKTKKNEGKIAGATGWMVKPFKPDQLLSVVRRLAG